MAVARDGHPIFALNRGVGLCVGRWLGVGAGTPTRIGATGRGLTLSRSGVGVLVVKLDDGWANVLAGLTEVHSTNLRDTKVTPIVTVAGQRQYTITVVNNSDVATDLAVGDEIQIIYFGSTSGVP